MSKTVGVTLTPAQAAKLMRGEPLEINLPPDAGKLIMKANLSEIQKIMNQYMGMENRKRPF